MQRLARVESVGKDTESAIGVLRLMVLLVQTLTFTTTAATNAHALATSPSVLPFMSTTILNPSPISTTTSASSWLEAKRKSAE
jgi:hypothetical protein